MVPTGTRKPIGRAKAVVYALLVHAVVISLLVLSFRWQSLSSPHPVQTIVQAHVVDNSAAKQAAAKLKQYQRQQQILQQQLQEQQQQQEQKLQQEQQLEQQQQQEQQLQQQEIARAKQTQAAARQKAAQAEKQRVVAAAEKKRQAALQKQLQKQAEQRQQRRAIASLQQQLAAEEQQREAAATAARTAAKAQSAIARYKDLIRQKVERNWVRPLNTEKGMECVVRVKLVPGGDVLQARVVQSSGNPVFDRSVENAVYKASPLPLPDDTTLFDYFRELEFTFKPES